MTNPATDRRHDAGGGDPLDAMADLLWAVEHDPRLRSTIVAVAVLGASPDRDRLRATVERAAEVVPRLSHRIATPALGWGPSSWERVDVDLDYHLRHVRCPEPGDERALLDLCAPIAMADFDRSRPLWEMTVVDELADGRTAVVQKLHHSVADGLGAIQLAAELYDLEADAPPKPDPPPAPTRGSANGPLGGVRRLADRQLRAARWSVGALSRPDRTVRFLASAGRILAPVGPPRSPLLIDRTMRRWLTALDVSLDDLRWASHTVGGTINDAFVAAVAGGIADYHRRQGTPTSELRLHVPISLRADGDGIGGNRWASARPVLRADIDDPGDRMRAVHDVVTAWREEPGIRAADALAEGLRLLPDPVVVRLVGQMMHGVDVVVTDVPGVDRPMWLAGARVEELVPFAPPGGAALNAALLSYDGVAHVGLTIDAGAVEDPPALGDCIRRAFDDVVAVGWDGD